MCTAWRGRHLLPDARKRLHHCDERRFGFTETRNGRLSIDSRAGFGATLALGKEWWVGSMADWGLGAALRGSFHSMKARVFGSLEHVYIGDPSIVFSATLN